MTPQERACAALRAGSALAVCISLPCAWRSLAPGLSDAVQLEAGLALVAPYVLVLLLTRPGRRWIGLVAAVSAAAVAIPAAGLAVFAILLTGGAMTRAGVESDRGFVTALVLMALAQLPMLAAGVWVLAQGQSPRTPRQDQRRQR